MGQAFLYGQSGGPVYSTLPAQITNFYATVGNQSVKLTWTNPSDSNFTGVLIVRKTGGYPLKISDGIQVYNGEGQEYTDTGLTNGTQYYYRAFTYNSKNEYQTRYCVATMTPKFGYLLGDLPVNSKIKFGSFSGKPIVQRIADISDNDITLITDGIIACYAFDAKEPSNNNSDRQNFGNNRYRYSNIHQWLNSDAEAGEWYSAQHSADHSPDSTNVVTQNPYASIAGFLNEFTEKEKRYLKTTSRIVGNFDAEAVETFSARIWLPSADELGIGSPYIEGVQLEAFAVSDVDFEENAKARIAYYADSCTPHTSYATGSAGWYWMRTPHDSKAHYVLAVNSQGYLLQGYAAMAGGVRPLCVLDSSILVSSSADSDGCYTIL